MDDKSNNQSTVLNYARLHRSVSAYTLKHSEITDEEKVFMDNFKQIPRRKSLIEFNRSKSRRRFDSGEYYMNKEKEAIANNTKKESN